MANYFPVALTGMAPLWLMNLPEASLTSWEELCRQFTANFESAYSRPGKEIDLHAMQQHLGESLRFFIQQFSQVRNTIPHISNASVVVAFYQDVRDEKMLEKLATHDIQDVAELFSLADKCARATEGRAWHTPPAPEEEKEGKPNTGAAAQGGGNNNNNKTASGNNQPLAGTPTVAAAAAASGVVAREMTSTLVKCPAATTMAHSARCINLGTIALESAGKSRSLQNSSMISSSNCAKMVRLPASGRVNKRWSLRRTRTKRWSSRMPRER
jgi:hypothetical protein